MDSYKLINFTELTLEQKEMILEWRNSEEIKKWMYSQKKIDYLDHINFIESLKKRKDKLYFLLKDQENYLGVIDFTEINKDSCYYGFYGNPNLKIPGMGRILEKISLDYAFNILKVTSLKLEVFKNNTQVRNLHKKNGFREVSEKIMNDKEVICMELNYEDR